MVEIEKMVQEFDEVYQQFEEAKRKNEFHEASDMKGYMCGLTKGMTITLDSNAMKYEQSDRRMVDSRISKLNLIDNVN